MTIHNYTDQAYKKQIHTLTVQILTPIHIGSGNVLQKGIDFFIDNGKVGIVDIKKLFNKIGQDKIQWWLEKIKDGADIWKELKTHSKLEDVCKEVLPSQISEIRYLREFIRNQYTNNPIIPGSSIKGAIRTAILSDYLNNNINILNNFYIHQNDNREDLEKKANSFTNKIFQNNNIGGKEVQNDVFRFIQIPDIELTKENISIVELNTLNWHGKNSDEGKWLIDRHLSSLLQVVMGSFELKIIVDERFFIYNKFNIKSFQDFLNKINKHNRELSQLEQELFENDTDKMNEKINENILECYNRILSNNKTTLLRLGFASGWDFITGSWAKDFPDEHWNWIKQKIVKPHYEKFFFPKTRRLVKLNNSYVIPGYISLSKSN